MFRVKKPQVLRSNKIQDQAIVLQRYWIGGSYNKIRDAVTITNNWLLNHETLVVKGKNTAIRCSATRCSTWNDWTQYLYMIIRVYLYFSIYVYCLSANSIKIKTITLVIILQRYLRNRIKVLPALLIARNSLRQIFILAQLQRLHLRLNLIFLAIKFFCRV